jgi:hypothetical protein
MFVPAFLAHLASERRAQGAHVPSASQSVHRTTTTPHQRHLHPPTLTQQYLRTVANVLSSLTKVGCQVKPSRHNLALGWALITRQHAKHSGLAYRCL